MSKIFLRAIIVSAVLQFITTRARAGRAEDEGAAEAMWLRFPAAVIVNALIWTLMFSTITRLVRPLRTRRS